jgi:hypothetical protein
VSHSADRRVLSHVCSRSSRFILRHILNHNGKSRPEFDELLSKPIRELGLKLEGSPLERFVQQLYRELERKKLRKFRPTCYLTDEWGCPSCEPVIGIPFYLASADLARLEKKPMIWKTGARS